MSADEGAGSGVPEVAIVGLGLIGGSVARRLASRGWRVRWTDPNVDENEVLATRDDLRLIELSELHICDLVLLATPTGIAIELLKEIDPGDAIVTSVCGVMRPFEAIARRREIRFVSGHPMAGRELGGWKSSLPGLFEGRPWFRSSGTKDDPDAVARIDRLIEACGAVPVPIDPVDHDRYAAVASHLPQLLSSALAAVIEQEGVPEPFHGPGLRTFLRLAGSPWSTWEPVFDQNAEPLLRAREALEKMVRRIDDGHGEDVFESGNRLHERLAKNESRPAKGKE